MRVSIVATSLDGQQPESKSVINMVHRIQNRNPGYSESQNQDSHQSFNFSSSVSHGANALKLENEVVTDNFNESVNDGLDIKGYYLWSFLDNFEWLFGYGPKFGLVEVDRNSLERKPKNSLKYYEKIIRNSST